MAEPMKIRTKMVDGSAHVFVLMMHPMETGQRKDPRSGGPGQAGTSYLAELFGMEFVKKLYTGQEVTYNRQK